mgnify:CR=1 FL=1
MNIAAIVVYFELQGKRMFLSTMSIRPDNKILATFIIDVAHAHLFQSMEIAKARIGQLVNHHNRELKTEVIMVKQSRKTPHLIKGAEWEKLIN